MCVTGTFFETRCRLYCFARNLLLSLPVKKSLKISQHLAKLEASVVEWHLFRGQGDTASRFRSSPNNELSSHVLVVHCGKQCLRTSVLNGTLQSLIGVHCLAQLLMFINSYRPFLTYGMRLPITTQHAAYAGSRVNAA